MIGRGNPSVSCGARAWERAPTPADMFASAHMLAALCITERRSKEPSRPCCALGIVIVQPLVAALGPANRLAHVLLCKSTQEAAPAHDEAKSRSRGAASTTGSAASDFSGAASRWSGLRYHEEDSERQRKEKCT